MASLRQCIRSLPCLNALRRGVRSPVHVQTRGAKRWVRGYLSEMYQRRLEAGPQPEYARSEFSNWNYDAEIYAFGKRLGEEFNENSLKAAFTHRSYVDTEEKKRHELGITDLSPLNIQDNTEFALKGERLASDFIISFLRRQYPHFIDEGIQVIHDHLMSEELLIHIGSHLGIKDLVNSVDRIPDDSLVALSLMAVIGALEHDCGTERAQKFVLDFFMSQLVGKDINEMFEILNPMGLLTETLSSQGRGDPEPRLLWESGTETLMAVYYVGIYSDKVLIGKSPGETVTIAEEMAARDALKNIWQTSLHKAPFDYQNPPVHEELSTSIS